MSLAAGCTALSAPQASALEGRWPSWRNRDLVPIPGIDADSLSEDSSTEGSSSSSSGSNSKSFRFRREAYPAKPASSAQRVRKWRLKFGVHKRLRSQLPPPPSHQLFEASKRRKGFLVVPGLLDAKEIELLHALWRHPSVEEIRDRKKTLNYRHTAFRMELALRAHGQILYRKLTDTMAWADARLWQRLSENEVAYPEVEYIVYDASGGIPGVIEPHVDNHSAVTIVILLSNPSEFSGGINCFASPGKGDLPARMLQLGCGDGVLFRGEKLRHWITPVTAGRRVVLQIELSRV